MKSVSRHAVPRHRMVAPSGSRDALFPPFRVSFQGGSPRDGLHDIAMEQAEALERMYGTPVYGHLIVRVPELEDVGSYTAALYLTMAGHIEVRVEPSDVADQAFTDPRKVIVDAFQHARGLIAEHLAHRPKKQPRRLAKRAPRTS